MDEWLRNAPASAYRRRHRVDFHRRYENILTRVREIFPHVGFAAARREILAVARKAAELSPGQSVEQLAESLRAIEEGPGYLTGHDEQHVRTVIHRAGDLLAAPGANITPREAFMLLVAILIHDAGNIYGRKGHEGRVRDILRLVRGRDLDAVESRAVQLIVEAHGGRTAAGSKDRIGLEVPPSEAFFDEDVRLQFLAALLRFADELADDYTRAAGVLMAAGELPKQSEAYHYYADSLKSVSVRHDPREVALTFYLNRDSATRKVGYDAGEVYLLDYIFERTLKMHLERVYCSRFLAPYGIHVDRISVVIRFVDDEERFHDEIAYRLTDQGYPTDGPLDAFCPDLRVPGSQECWSGEVLRNRVLRTQEGNHG
ncbi:MAG: hypothetical protein AB1486_32505 [Planctomycetota bacterium]